MTGSLLEIGTKRGQAAPGESSPSALLTSRGGIILVDSTGKPVQKPLGAAGLFLGSDGTDLLYRQPPGYLTANDLGATFTTASVGSAETSVLSAGAIAAAFPAMVAIGDAVRITAAGVYTNASGANQGLTLNLYMGGILIATAASGNLANSATARPWEVDVTVVYTVSGGAGAGSVRPAGHVNQATSSTAVQATALGGVATTVTTNAAQSVDLKGQTTTATTGSTIVCNILQARWFPKNY